MTMELDNIRQSHKVTNSPGTNTVFSLDHDTIKNIPANGKITHANVFVDYRLQELDTNRVTITVGEIVIEHPMKLQQKQQNLSLSKYFGNSVVSIPHAEYVCADIVKSFFTSTHQWSTLNTCKCQSN